MGHDVADDGMTDEGQVADHVEDLVAHELVFEPERVQHAGLTDDDGVVERSAEREPVLPQHLDFLEEAERPRRRDVFDKRVFRNAQRA